MLFRWLFSGFSESKKLNYLKKQGIVLGSRIRDGRKIYLYMMGDFFVEVIYKNDDIDHVPEYLNTFSNLRDLNSYLTTDLKKELGKAF